MFIFDNEPFFPSSQCNSLLGVPLFIRSSSKCSSSTPVDLGMQWGNQQQSINIYMNIFLHLVISIMKKANGKPILNCGEKSLSEALSKGETLGSYSYHVICIQLLCCDPGGRDPLTPTGYWVQMIPSPCCMNTDLSLTYCIHLSQWNCCPTLIPFPFPQDRVNVPSANPLSKEKHRVSCSAAAGSLPVSDSLMDIFSLLPPSCCLTLPGFLLGLSPCLLCP